MFRHCLGFHTPSIPPFGNEPRPPNSESPRGSCLRGSGFTSRWHTGCSVENGAGRRCEGKEKNHAPRGLAAPALRSSRPNPALLLTHCRAGTASPRLKFSYEMIIMPLLSWDHYGIKWDGTWPDAKRTTRVNRCRLVAAAVTGKRPSQRTLLNATREGLHVFRMLVAPFTGKHRRIRITIRVTKMGLKCYRNVSIT